jgi:Fe-S oxidoreductase
MAKMKLEVQVARARKHGYSFHQRLIAHLPRYAPVLSKIGGLVNLRNSQPWLAKLLEPLTGFAAHRALPLWAVNSFKDESTASASTRDVVLLADTFNTWFEPEVLRDARKVLEAAGFRVNLAQLPGKRKLCCGRTYLAAGMVEQARNEAQRMLDALIPWAEKGVSIVGLEPSCLLTLRDEYKVLLPGKNTDTVAAHAMLLEEFLLKEHEAGTLNWTLTAPAPKALVHGHCHQKAMSVFSTVQKTLALIPNLEVVVIESSCCGMAGAFGYAKDTADVSEKMAELDLLPAVRTATADTLIVADGTSCRHQIAGGSERDAIHVAQVLALALESGKTTSSPSSEENNLLHLSANTAKDSPQSNLGGAT